MAHNLPKNKIPSSFTKGIYTPELVARNQELNDLVQEAIIPTDREKARERIANRGTRPPSTRDSVPIPMTELEAIEADLQIDNARQRIAAARAKLDFTRNAIDAAISNATGGKELTFKLDISNKPHVKKAIRKLFGVSTDTITMSMYKELLKAKSQIEKQEVDDYSKGKTKPTKTKRED